MNKCPETEKISYYIDKNLECRECASPCKKCFEKGFDTCSECRVPYLLSETSCLL